MTPPSQQALRAGLETALPVGVLAAAVGLELILSDWSDSASIDNRRFTCILTYENRRIDPFICSLCAVEVQMRLFCADLHGFDIHNGALQQPCSIFFREISMKNRTYQFTSNMIEGGIHSKNEIIKSLKHFARIVSSNTFTQNEYAAWKDRVYHPQHISSRFGSWEQAMAAAGLRSSWCREKDPAAMMDLYLDCWEAHDEAPTERRLREYLIVQNSDQTANVVMKYFGGLRRMQKIVIEFQTGRISELELLEEFKNPVIRKQLIVYSLSSSRDGKPRYVGDTDSPKERFRIHVSDAKSKDTNLAKWFAAELSDGFKIDMNTLQDGNVTRPKSEKLWIRKLRAEGADLFNTANG